jgi:pullulanase/glycogen debranching enzyme
MFLKSEEKSALKKILIISCKREDGMEKSKSKDWYKDAIIYQAHVRSFKDSNGDGIGDFKGLIQKLGYLKSLG